MLKSILHILDFYLLALAFIYISIKVLKATKKGIITYEEIWAL